MKLFIQKPEKMEMSFESEEASYNNPFNKTSQGTGSCLPDSPMANAFQLKSAYPLGTILDAFVTNVHNVPQLRFFMFVKSPETAQHFASVRFASTPPNAHKCTRIPREGNVFALRLGESTMLRAIRLRTLCITSTREVFLPDIGRNELLNEDEVEMYHLPMKLRTTPGIAIPCQLRGVNDDVTILPDNMRTFLRGLLFHSVKLRVDGYIGAMLKVQLCDVTMEQLLKWTAELGPEEHDFPFALKHTILCNTEIIEIKPIEKSRLDISENGKLSPIAEEYFYDENIGPSPTTISIPSTTSTLPIPLSQDSFLTALDETIIIDDSSSAVVSAATEDMVLSTVSTVSNSNSEDNEKLVKQQDTQVKILFDFQKVSEKLLVDFANVFSAEMFPLNPLLGRANEQVRPILGDTFLKLADNSWKQDILPALVKIDNRQTIMNFSRDELITITPTYIGQLERFFGIVHRRNECYLQHMWTDDEIPWSNRFTGSFVPYVFDIVLAKHGGDFKWYRAKVIEICKEQRKVRVFYVDYGGVEDVDMSNLAYLSSSICKLPFQAVLFRLYDLVDVTATKAERSLGVEFLRSVLLKQTLSVRVVKCRGQEITICFEDQRFSNVSTTLIRKGLMKHFSSMQ